MTLAQARCPTRSSLSVHLAFQRALASCSSMRLPFGRHRWDVPRLSRSLVLAAAALVARARSRDAVSFPVVRDLTAADMIASSGARVVTERMEAWGVGSLDDHVLVLVDAPAAPFVGNSRLRCCRVGCD